MSELVSQENEFKPPVQINASAGVAIGATREAQEVFGMIMAAKHFPRDKFSAVNSILESCQRHSLAVKAEYSYPRGGQTISGPSIKLAEVIAQNWGNIDYGIRELERGEDETMMQAYCWDIQTNTRRTQNFTVAHYRDTKAAGKKRLTDERDIYEVAANNGARRVRACILAVIPGDVVDKAVSACRKTIAKGNGLTREDSIIQVVAIFSAIGVQKEMIEKRLGHKVESCSSDEIAELIGIYNSIKDQMSKRQDWFDLGESAQCEATQSLNEKFSAKQPTEKRTREPGEEID